MERVRHKLSPGTEECYSDRSCSFTEGNPYLRGFEGRSPKSDDPAVKNEASAWLLRCGALARVIVPLHAPSFYSLFHRDPFNPVSSRSTFVIDEKCILDARETLAEQISALSRMFLLVYRQIRVSDRTALQLERIDSFVIECILEVFVYREFHRTRWHNRTRDHLIARLSFRQLNFPSSRWISKAIALASTFLLSGPSRGFDLSQQLINNDGGNTVGLAKKQYSIEELPKVYSPCGNPRHDLCLETSRGSTPARGEGGGGWKKNRGNTKGE